MASPAIDAFITFRFLKLLVTPFDKTEAYKLGIIDERGKVLKKYRSLERVEERRAYTILHRLVFNIKKLIEKYTVNKKLHIDSPFKDEVIIFDEVHNFISRIVNKLKSKDKN